MALPRLLVVYLYRRCFSSGPVEPGRLLNVLGKPRGPDTVETNVQQEDPWGAAVMNGSKQFVYFSRFMGLVSFPGPGVFAYVYKKGQVQDFVCCVRLQQSGLVWGPVDQTAVTWIQHSFLFFLTGLAKCSAGEGENNCFWQDLCSVFRWGRGKLH